MIFIVFLIGALAAAVPVAASVTALKLETQAVKGDWEEILKRGTIRVAVPYSRTLFFNDRGNQMGLTAEIIREFEQCQKKKYPKRSRPVTVVAIPTTLDKLVA